MRIRLQWLWLTLPLLAVTVSAEDAAQPSTPAVAVKEVVLGDLKLSVPSRWTQEQPDSVKRLAQFSVRALGGDKDPSVFLVSPPIGSPPIEGTREANLTRWIKQFEKDNREVVISQGKCPQGDYVAIEISGTFRRPVGPIGNKTEPVEGYHMKGVILTVAKEGKVVGDYYLKLLGPSNTVNAYGDSLRVAVGADKSKEEKYELPQGTQ